jgi:hypothetical protein
MKISKIPFNLQLVNDHSRSPGVHLSQVIKKVGLKVGYIPPQFASEDSMNATKVCMGLAWEDHLAAHQHPDILYHPGELVLDGIAMTPDGLSFVDDGILHEFKLTWKSMKKENDLEGEWLWICQMMSYCKAAGLTRAWLHVLWVNGNYKYGDAENGGVQYRIYQFDFTKQELNDNWATIQRNSTPERMAR